MTEYRCSDPSVAELYDVAESDEADGRRYVARWAEHRDGSHRAWIIAQVRADDGAWLDTRDTVSVPVTSLAPEAVSAAWELATASYLRVYGPPAWRRPRGRA